VRTRAIADPLIGDAIDSLGYDTLVRDACRILLALKDKNVAACKAIASSALKGRCETYAAVIAKDPNLCPLSGEGARLATRDPTCLARANRDERLCAATLPSDRSRCRALVLGRTSECGQNPSCVREVDRNRSLIEKPENRPPIASRLHVEIAPDTPKGEERRSFDLDEVAAAGAALRVVGDKVRLSVGTPKNVSWPPSPNGPLASPRVFVELSLPSRSAEASARGASRKKTASGSGVALGATDLRLDLLVPKIGLLSALTGAESKVEVRQLSTVVGEPIRFVLTVPLRDATNMFTVMLDVDTFVRERSGPVEPAGAP
jgi:hypothetical protein